MIAYPKKDCYTIDDLIEIVAILRSKDGCPWDKEQTPESLTEYLILPSEWTLSKRSMKR